MTSDARLARVLTRRETHRSRSASAVVMLLILAVAAAYAGTECALAALRLRPLLVSPAAVVEAWHAGSPAVLGGAAVAAVLGVIALLLAITSSRRARHVVEDPRTVILVEDDLLASAVSQTVARRTGVAPAQTRTAIGRRSASIDVTPVSGVPLSSDEVREHADALVQGLRLRPSVRVRARVAPNGVVGG